MAHHVRRSPRSRYLLDAARDRALEQPAVDSVGATPRRERMLRVRPRHKRPAGEVHLLSVPRVNVHRRAGEVRGRLDELRKRRRVHVQRLAVG